MTEKLNWYIAGPLIGLMVPLLLILREKQLGISSGFRYLASTVVPKKLPYLNYKRSDDRWQLEFAFGIFIAALLFAHFGWIRFTPEQDTLVYSVENIGSFLAGGMFIGFGARLAGGCTAGHCIMGNAQLSLASVISTTAFFIGGWLASNFIVQLIAINL